MAFYVKLGPRGLIFRIGTMIIAVVGGVAYWRASRRRAALGHAIRGPRGAALNRSSSRSNVP